MTNFEVEADYETAERIGASGTFQIISVTEEDASGKRIDWTEEFDQGRHFRDEEEVSAEIARTLKRQPDTFTVIIS